MENQAPALGAGHHAWVSGRRLDPRPQRCGGSPPAVISVSRRPGRADTRYLTYRRAGRDEPGPGQYLLGGGVLAGAGLPSSKSYRLNRPRTEPSSATST
jgi:hypothetical protein